MSPEVEERLVTDHPGLAESRGIVNFWNFLPPDELNAILTLYSKVTHKTLLISQTLGIEGRQLLTPEDDYEALKEFNSAYEGVKTVVEDMHLEYQGLVDADPELEGRLSRLPGSVFSGRRKQAKGSSGVFFCIRLPALDRENGEFTYDAGTTRWYLYDAEHDSIVEEPPAIVEAIRSTPTTPRESSMPEEALKAIRDKVEDHIKNTYLKRVDAPMGVRPALRCWMELADESS